jgi:hypothetical protein
MKIYFIGENPEPATIDKAIEISKLHENGLSFTQIAKIKDLGRRYIIELKKLGDKLRDEQAKKEGEQIA